MKKICTLLLTAGMLMGVATGASAIDFKAKGQWNVGFGLVDTNWEGNRKNNGEDLFQAQQRVRLQIDAVASEALSGTVYFEMGETVWGNQASGGALGTDGKIIELKHAYIDWFVPNTMLSFRMGLQAVAVPNAAGGAVILDDDAAAVMANYKFNDMVSLTFGWIRLYNDNFNNNPWTTPNDQWSTDNNYLDNIDAFMISLPVQGENWSVNPWFMVGWYGTNSLKTAFDDQLNDTTSPAINFGLGQSFIPAFNGAASAVVGMDGGPGGTHNGSNFWNASEDEYTTFWFAGIPVTFQMDNWNFELDFNYGYVGYSGTYSPDYARGHIFNNGNNDLIADRFGPRSDMTRSGWLLKGLVEYKMDWGTPGLFAWYGSGDNDDVTDGSEMMPIISPSGNFTSFLGDGEFGWQPGAAYDQMLSYSGTWGIGLQIKDLSFMEDLSHVIRIAYWGGTNDSNMVNFVQSPYSNSSNAGGFYLVEGDYLVEINFDTKYQIYDNLAMHFQLGYIFNGIDTDQWNANRTNRRVSAYDGYKATLSFSYSF